MSDELDPNEKQEDEESSKNQDQEEEFDPVLGQRARTKIPSVITERTISDIYGQELIVDNFVNAISDMSIDEFEDRGVELRMYLRKHAHISDIKQLFFEDLITALRAKGIVRDAINRNLSEDVVPQNEVVEILQDIRDALTFIKNTTSDIWHEVSSQSSPAVQHACTCGSNCQDDEQEIVTSTDDVDNEDHSSSMPPNADQDEEAMRKWIETLR